METERERYERVRERARKLEAEKAEYLARGEPIPARIVYGFKGAAIELEEARLYGHREMVRELREARAAAEERIIDERVGSELERIRNAPTLEPEYVRDAREALGITLGQLATASGVDASTVWRVENGHPHKPETLLLIAAGLQYIRDARERTHTRAE